jgi:hypothetical protein
LPARAGFCRFRRRATFGRGVPMRAKGNGRPYSRDLGTLQTFVKGRQMKLQAKGFTTARITIAITSTNGTSLTIR